MAKRLTILHTNDLHGRYERWLKQAALIRARKAELEAQGDLVLLVDAGDHMDFSIEECMTTNGHLHLQMLADLGVQAFVPGNNELFRTPVPLIRELSLKSEVPWLLANLREVAGRGLAGCLIRCYSIWVVA